MKMSDFLSKTESKKSKKEESFKIDNNKNILLDEPSLNEGNKKLDISADVEVEYDLAELGK